MFILPDIPDDTQAISISEASTIRARTDLENWELRHQLIDTFTVDHLLGKLASESVLVRSCFSPNDNDFMPFFKSYLKPSEVNGREFICIPLCDGVHFQGYIVDVKTRTIIHVDSFTKNPDNATAKAIAKIFFKDQSVIFKSLWQSRRQFDSNSCGAWLVAGMSSFFHQLPEVTDRHSAFEICYSMLERDTPNVLKSVEPKKTDPRLQIADEDHTKKFSKADFLLNILLEPEKSEYFCEIPPKGIRTNLFYVTDSSRTSMADILADDNGAYLNSRSNKKLYFCTDGQTYIVREDNEQFYYSIRQSFNFYSKVYVKPENVISITRKYSKAKSFPLSRTIISISNPFNGPVSPYIAVLYQALDNISEDAKCLPHGNAKKLSAKSYFRTSKNVLEKTKQKLDGGMDPKKVYDEVNNESGGVFYSTSQSNELRDMKQVYRQNKKDKSCPLVADELTSAILLQQDDPQFIRSVSSLNKFYYIFLGNDEQFEDIVTFCCEKENVLCVDTTFNLCENWVSDCCYSNMRLVNSEGMPPTFLGPVMIHFNKAEISFTRFLMEMMTIKPEIRNLKVLGTDLEKSIYNGFLSLAPDLRLLLCVLHLYKNDKKKLSESSPKGGIVSINQILSDIYGRRLGSIREIGLVDATDAKDLSERLEQMKESWMKLCPGFYEWFVKKRKPVFVDSVIESARVNTNVQGLFYNNGIESQHFLEKKEQAFKKGSISDVVKTVKTIIERQQNDEVRALYGSGPYHLSEQLKKFAVEPVKWHAMDAERRNRHIRKYRSYRPTLTDQFEKPKASGRKPNEGKRIRKPDIDTVCEPDPKIQAKPMQNTMQNQNQDQINVKVLDPNAPPPIVYELHLRSMVPRLVQRCQGYCQRNLVPADNQDYFIVKSYARSFYTSNKQQMSKIAPQYVHFSADCLKEYARRKLNIEYQNFPFDLVKIDAQTYSRLSDENIAFLLSYGVSPP